MVVYWDDYEHDQCKHPSLDKLIQARDLQCRKMLDWKMRV